MGFQKWPEKDPEDVLNYTRDWTTWLAGDTISTVVWTIAPSGVGSLTLAGQSNTTTTATAKLSGGVVGTTYAVECKITTAAGLTAERTATIKVKEL